MISAANAGKSAAISLGLTEPWPLPTIVIRIARSHADGIVISRPAIEPIWTHVRFAASSPRCLSTAGITNWVASPQR